MTLRWSKFSSFFQCTSRDRFSSICSPCAAVLPKPDGFPFSLQVPSKVLGRFITSQAPQVPNKEILPRCSTSVTSHIRCGGESWGNIPLHVPPLMRMTGSCVGHQDRVHPRRRKPVLSNTPKWTSARTLIVPGAGLAKPTVMVTDELGRPLRGGLLHFLRLRLIANNTN